MVVFEPPEIFEAMTTNEPDMKDAVTPESSVNDKGIRMLCAQIPMPQNRFLVDLNNSLEKSCSITHSSERFWNMEGDYDIVHIHIPEHMTYAIEEEYFSGLKHGPEHGLTQRMIDETCLRLKYWADKSHIVVTRHVLLPHDAVEDPMWERMYELIYRHADGVAHFAQASVDEFRERYRDTVWHRGREPVHAIIPHQNYASLPNRVSREEARRKLGIDRDSRVMLVFGAIRNDRELALVRDTFDGLRVKRKLLLVSSWRERLRKISWIRLKYWVRDLTRLYYRLHPSYHFHYGFVEEADAQLYLNAADVLFIPRFRVLNSGNVTMGMTFGKVVVGPDSWDVGELLRKTGNPVFDPDRPETAAAAVEEGFRLAAEGVVGPRSQELALREWGADRCAELYLGLYSEAVKR